MHLNPTQVAILVFGSARRLSLAIGVRSSAPFCWLEQRQGRNEAGDIPVPRIREILAVAKQKGLELSERDLIYGRDVADPVPAPEPVAAG